MPAGRQCTSFYGFFLASLKCNNVANIGFLVILLKGGKFLDVFTSINQLLPQFIAMTDSIASAGLAGICLS